MVLASVLLVQPEQKLIVQALDIKWSVRLAWLLRPGIEELSVRYHGLVSDSKRGIKSMLNRIQSAELSSRFSWPVKCCLKSNEESIVRKTSDSHRVTFLAFALAPSLAARRNLSRRDIRTVSAASADDSLMPR